MEQRIRTILQDSKLLSQPMAFIQNDTDLFAAGLTSFGTVQLMLALEEAFDVEFPERMLSRKLFSSIDAMCAALSELKAEVA